MTIALRLSLGRRGWITGLEPDSHCAGLAVGPGVVGDGRYHGGTSLSIPFVRMHGTVEVLFPPIVRRDRLGLGLQHSHATEQFGVEADGEECIIEDQVAQVDTGVVCLLGAIEQGPPHKCNASRVLGDVGVAFDPSERYGQVHVYGVARTPRAAEVRVRTRRDPGVHRFAVHPNLGAFLAPGWDAEHYGVFAFGFDSDLHPSIPRVARALVEPDGPVLVKLDGRCALRVEVYPDGAG